MKHKLLNSLAIALALAASNSISHGAGFTTSVENTSAAEDSTEQKQFAKLPIAVTSFGAARIGNSLYIYGGHTGDAHAYSNKEQSNKLLKLDIDKPTQWQEVATGERLQGLAMVAHKQRVILIGGFTAMNAEGEKQDLRSQSTVRAFDTQKNEWLNLPSLPKPRSSHDACIVGDSVFVLGGWNMQGDKETEWHSTALRLDLSQASPAWQEIATPPFQRRALAVVEHSGLVYAIGGMNQNGGPTQAVAVYDPKANHWSECGALLGEKPMAGFGASAWSIHGSLVATTIEGDVQELNEKSRSWSSIGKTKDARFFHRVLPLDGNHLVSLGGASMSTGKFTDVEVIQVGK